MSSKEIIRLDAQVLDMIAQSVFSAELSNGHRIVAYPKPEDREVVGQIKPGDRVTVEMSPFDMSRGCMVEWKFKGSE